MYYEDAGRQYGDCTLCPRECHSDRLRGDAGICRTGAGFEIASVCIHRGEEPSISGTSGICNIFFEGCNLRCIYCQNHRISQRRSGKRPESGLDSVLDSIERILETGVNAVGFVSPSHVVPQVKAIIHGLRSRGLKPITVYNTNSYDKVETLRDLAGLIDVYLPDLKYVTPELALQYSGVSDYPEVALKAVKEMYYQKGSVIRYDDNGRAENGMLIRHLVLPGHTEESIKVLELIAGELSTGVHISLMSQYHPDYLAVNHPLLGNPLTEDEYSMVAGAMERLGFRNGWLQDTDSCMNYLPDFNKTDPFEEDEIRTRGGMLKKGAT